MSVSISAPFIRRPIATSLLAAALLLAGILAFLKLPVAPLPRVDFPTIQVSASLPGASPETMASSVATPLERRFGRIAGQHLHHAAVRPRQERRRGRTRRAGGHRGGRGRASAQLAREADVQEGQP